MPTEQDRKDHGNSRAPLDPGAYIGHEPELEAESIPGGVGHRDERISAYGSRPGVPGEPDADPADTSDTTDTSEGDPAGG